MHGGQWLHGALIKLSTSEHPQGQESALKMDDFRKNIPFTQFASSFNSFFVTQLYRLWNHLPYEVVSTPTFMSFKKAVSKYLLNS